MIRKIEEKDKPLYLAMAKRFYSSAAVYRDVPEKHFFDTFEELMRSDKYAEGYLIEYENQPAGYALLAKTFSQEAGGMVLWIEELFILPQYRRRGLGHEFFGYLKNNLPRTVKRVRLEVEADNRGAVSLYRRMGFEDLPYSQMFFDFKCR